MTNLQARARYRHGRSGYEEGSTAHVPSRQWVLSVPFPLRFLFASQPKMMGKALGIVYRKVGEGTLPEYAQGTSKNSPMGTNTAVGGTGAAGTGALWWSADTGLFRSGSER